MQSKSEGSRLLSLVLFSTGVFGLVASIYISARVGWSLADHAADKFVTAGVLGLADFASAMLIVAAARMRVWRWYARSYIAIGISCIFLASGYVTAYGFFSTRIAVHESQKATAAVEKDYLKWAQGQTINMLLPKSERRTMLAEVKSGRDALKSTMSVVSDKYAAAIGAWLGWSVEDTQTRLTAAAAAIAYLVKFGGLWVGVQLWPRRREEDERKTTGNTDGSGDIKKDNVVTLHKPEPTTVANAEPLNQPEVTTPAMNAAPLSPPKQTTVPLTVSSVPPVESIAPTQQRWTAEEVDAHLSRIAEDPDRISWRAMGRMTGWDHAQLFKRHQRLLGVNNAGRRALGQRRVQHRQQENRNPYPH